jgi:DNA repair protein RadD
MVATHVSELLEQNSSKLLSLMPDADVGFYSAQLGEKEKDNEIVFAGIQSIFRQKNLKAFNLLIVDESHTIGRKESTMWGKLIAKMKEVNPKLRIVGFSATPFRLDSGSLTSGDDAIFDEIVYDYSLARAIQDGYLCPITAKFTETKYNIDGVGKIGGEYNLKQLEAATNVDDLTQKAVKEMIFRSGDRKSWLVFCNGIAHSFSIRDELRRQGISCETVTGETPDYERAQILSDFKSGKIRAVTNNAVWTTGIDVPNVDVIGMLRHTMSGGLLLQMAGRGTRIMTDISDCTTAKDRRDKIASSIKPNVLFLDFAGNIERHGFLDEITAKDKKKPGDGVAPMKACPECWTICHAAAKACKDCGYEFPKNEVSHIHDVYDGALFGGEPEKRIVMDVEYYPWNLNKEGKIPCLLVKYNHPDGTHTREYICLQHNGFAYQKAYQWWLERKTNLINMDISGLTIEEIIKEKYC